jgi:hypothetical protein
VAHPHEGILLNDKKWFQPPALREKGKKEDVKHRDFLGPGSYSVWYCNGRCMTPYIWEKPYSSTTQSEPQYEPLTIVKSNESHVSNRKPTGSI